MRRIVTLLFISAIMIQGAFSQSMDVSVTNLSPLTGTYCDNNYPVSVMVVNNDPVQPTPGAVIVEYYLDGVLVAAVPTLAPLPGGGSEMVNLGIFGNKPGKHNITAVALYPGDINPLDNFQNSTVTIQFNGTYTIGALPADHFSTIKMAVDTLNTYGVCGPTVFNIPAAYTELLTARINLTATGTAINTITFQKAGLGANPLLTAYAGAFTPSSATPDGMWALVGSDYITIDGIDLYDPNAANPATMEYGYGLFKAGTSNGAQYNTIKNCTVTLNRNNFAGGTSPMVEGSVGILIINSAPTTATTAITPVSADGTNSYNMIYGNTLQNLNYGIVLSGYAAATPFTLGDTGNDIGGVSALTGNTVINYGGGTSASNPAAGIRANNQWGINISYNTINSNNGGGANHPNTLRGIFAQAGTSASAVISYNTVTIHGGGTTSTLEAISNAIGSTAASNTININNNIVQNCTYSTATSGMFSGITNTASAAQVNIFNNRVSNNSQAGTGTWTGINGGAPTNLSMHHDTVTNNSKTGASGTMMLTTAATSIIDCYDNKINDNGFTASSGTSSCIIYGYYNNGLPTVENLYNNSIYNLSVGGTSTATASLINGIHTTSTATANKQIYNNQIYNFSALSGTVNGVLQGFGTSVRIYKNRIYNLSTGATTTTAAVANGITISSGNVYAYNNYISDIKAPASASTDAVRGINSTSLTTASTVGLYYNTIYLNASSTGANFGSSGVFHTYSATSTTAALDMRNNIIVNMSTPNGTGNTVAFRRSASTSLLNFATANNNVFYAGTPGANRLIFFDGTNADQTLAAYQARVSPRDDVSISLMPPFVDVVTTPYNLHIQTTVSTGIESGGAQVSTPIAVTDDYENDIRYGEAGYSGSGSAPDIGADEFNGIPSYTCAAPNPGNTLASDNPVCENQEITLSLQNATAGTGVSYQWQSSADGMSFSDIAGETSSTYTFIPTDSIWYQCIVVCQNGPTADTSAPLQIDFANYVTAIAGGSRCGTGTVDISASGSAGSTIYWYDVPSGGLPIGSGSPFTTPSIAATTNFYASAHSGYLLETGGKTTLGTTSGSALTNYGLIFDALSDFYITSVDVYPSTTAGTMNISVFNSSSQRIAGPIDVAFPAGDGTTPFRAFLNLYVPAGTGHRILITSRTGGNLIRESSGVTFPINSPTLMNITAAATSMSGSSPSSYNWFYNIQLTAGCASERLMATATVTPPPALTISNDQTVCNNAVASLTVTSVIADFDTYTWSPVTDLFTDMACTVPYVGGQSATTVYVKSNVAGTVTYTCTATDTISLCANTAEADITTLPAAPVVTASPDELCMTGISVLTVSPASGYGAATFQWQSSNDSLTFTDIPGATSLNDTTALLNSTTFYILVVKDGSGNTCTQSPAKVNVLVPSLAGTSPGTRCGIGTVTLGATAAGIENLSWYNVPSGGAILGTGSSFVTPVISDTTNFYVQPAFGTPAEDAGRLAPGGGSGANLTTYGQDFTITEGLLLNSVNVHSTTGTSITISLYSSGGASQLQTTGPVGVPVGVESTVNLGWYLYPGTYRLMANGMTGSFIRENSGVTYPIALSTVGQINGFVSSVTGSVTTSASYYFMYKWNMTVGCIGNRVLVPAYVTTPPAVTALASPADVCNGSNTTLSVTSPNDPNYNYLWMPGNLSGASQIITPGATTTYNVTATDASGGVNDGCVNSAAVTVTVHPVPGAVTITPASATICSGDVQMLTASGGEISGTITLGSAQSTSVGSSSSSTLGPNPMQNYYGGSKQQMIYTASELVTAGIFAGSSIGSVSINLPAADPAYDLQGFTVKMGHTTETAYSGTSAWITSGLVTVRNTANYTPVVGLNTIALDVPFNWDGTSNIVLEFAYSNNNAGTAGTTNTSTYSSTPFVSTLFYRADSQTPATLIGYTGAANWSYSARTDVTFGIFVPTTMIWSPTTGLYTDAGATIAYAGTDLNTVYAKPNTSTTYTATGGSAFCTETDNVSITVDDLQITGVSYTPITCYNANNGSITITASGGIGAIEYSIDNGGTWNAGNIFSGLAPGSYSIRIRDTHPCEVIYSMNPIVLSNPADLVIDTVISTDVTSCSLSDGTIGITASGGTGSLQYSIDNGSNWFTTSSFSGLAAGSYQIQVKDSMNCTKTYTYNPVVVGTPVAVVIDSVKSTDLSCHMSNDGTITIYHSAGTPPFEYSNDGGLSWISNGGTFTGLAAGSYNIAVKDNAGCITVYGANPVVLTQPDLLEVTISKTDVLCYGQFNGTATANVTGGTAPYDYEWWGIGSSQTATGLGANSYFVIVTDTNNCVDTAWVSILEPAAIAITGVGMSNVSCLGGSDGEISITANGGAGALSYSIDNGTTWQSSNSFTGLIAGSYTVAVKDTNNCELVYNGNPVIITEPATAVSISGVVSDDSPCFGEAGGSISITATGGTGSLQYSIDGGTTWQAGSGIFTALFADDYDIEVMDSLGCTAVYSMNPVQILEAAQITFDQVLTTDITCNGGNDGEIHISASGGTGPFSYSADSGATWQINGDFLNLTAGDYDLMIRDSLGCEVAFGMNPVIISEPPALFITVVSASDVNCFNGSDGSITVTAGGGSTALLYSIDGGTNWQTSNVFSGLTAGNYNVVIKDSLDCSLIHGFNPVIVDQPATALSITAVNSTDVLCNGGTTGTISITATGGTPVYEFSIDSGASWQASANFNTVIAGSYDVLVRDDNNCVAAYASNPVVIAQPAVLAISNVSSTNALCLNSDDGSITITATGGTIPYEYSIDNGSNWVASSSFSGLEPGNYNIRVRDDNGCLVIYASNPVVITEPATAVVIDSVQSVDLPCNGGNGGSIIVFGQGGTSPYQVSADNGLTWTPGLTASGLAAGDHYVWLRDNNGCSVLFTGNPITLIEPDPMIISGINASDASCNGNSNGSIEIYGIGGTGALQYSIDSGATWQSSYAFTNVAAGTYYLAISDANGCELFYTSNPVIISEPAAVVITNLDVYENECYGANDGSILISANGGTGTLEYSINNGATWQTSALFSDLYSGYYTVWVRDENLCSVEYPMNPVFVDQPTEIVIYQVDSTNVTTYGGNDGSITVMANGGTGILLYSIDNGATWQPSNTFEGLIAGGYYVQVIDANGCVVTYWSNPVVISEPSGISENGDDVFSIWPNPTKNEIMISSSAIGQVEKIEVMDVNGKVVDAIVPEVMSGNVFSMTYDFSGMARGVYSLRLTTEREVYNYKVVVN